MTGIILENITNINDLTMFSKAYNTCVDYGLEALNLDENTIKIVKLV